MINAIFVMFFQAAAGAPATPPVEPVAPVAAPAATPAAPEAPATEEPAADPNRKICRNISVVGSRVPIRQCRTAAEEDAERVASRRFLERAQSHMPTNAN